MARVSRPLNVLSIDWDYFINADETERALRFPDIPNELYPEEIRNVIWASRYTDSNLEEIKLNQSAVDEFERMMRSYGFDTKFARITDSHRHCYDFVKSIMKSYKYTNINLVNVDFHHDVWDRWTSADWRKGEIDCANWLRVLMIDYPLGEYTWVKHPGSSDEEREEVFNVELHETTDIDIIHHTYWDAIFFCRSDMWSPPHLDDEFIRLAQVLSCSCTKSCGFDREVRNSRYSEMFRAMVERDRAERQRVRDMLAIK